MPMQDLHEGYRSLHPNVSIWQVGPEPQSSFMCVVSEDSKAANTSTAQTITASLQQVA